MSMQTKTYSRRPGSPTRRPSSRPSSATSQQKKPWQQTHRRPSIRSGHSKSRVHPDSEEEERLSRQASRQSVRSKRRTSKWWKIRLFRGMVDDVKRRAPLYLSDWTDAWDYRVVPATVYMYVAKYGDVTPPLFLFAHHSVHCVSMAMRPSQTYFLFDLAIYLEVSLSLS